VNSLLTVLGSVLNILGSSLRGKMSGVKTLLFLLHYFYRKIRNELDLVKSGQMDDQVKEMWERLQE